MFKKKGPNFTFFRTLAFLIFIGMIFVFTITYMYYNGAIYHPSKHSTCTSSVLGQQEKNTTFCDIAVIELPTEGGGIPPILKHNIVSLIKSGAGKYVSIPRWKGGRTIPTQTCMQQVPDLVHFYHRMTSVVSSHLGVLVTTTPLHLPTSCAILVYEKEGDFINWHYDVNYYRGRFFTLLIPLFYYTNTNDITLSTESSQGTDPNLYCTKFYYRDRDQNDIAIDILGRNSVLFEGEHVFHMASRLCKNEKRAIISMQFVTDDSMGGFMARALMRLKDIAYVG